MDTSSDRRGGRGEEGFPHSIFGLSFQKRRHRRLAQGRKLGKLSQHTMASTIWRLKGVKSRKVIVGPSPGVDVSVLDIGRGEVMVENCDPISLIPSIGPEDSARMSLYEVASDVATSGRSPRFVMLDLNLPPGMSDQVLSRYWKAINRTCLEIGDLYIVGTTLYIVIGYSLLVMFTTSGL